MNVTITNVADTNLTTNDQASKILFTDNLIEHFAPLFYEETRTKQKQNSNNETDIKKLKNLISEIEKKLSSTKSEVELETVKNQILKEIELLNEIDVLYGNSKLLVQKIIASLDSQTKQELEKKLVLLQKLTSQRKKG